MKGKTFFLFFIIFSLASAIVFASNFEIYDTDTSQSLLITSFDNSTFNHSVYVNDNITADFINAEMSWINLTNYPTGCGVGYAVQVIGDTLTCVALNGTGSFVMYGGDNMTGDYFINGTLGIGGDEFENAKMYWENGSYVIKVSNKINWSPANTEVAAWYDADDYSTITESGTVSEWEDKSGNGHDMTQGTGSSQPNYNSADSRMNNKPSIGYSGSTRKFLESVDTIVSKRAYMMIYYDNATFSSWNPPIASSDNVPRMTGRSLQNYWQGANINYSHKDGNDTLNYDNQASLPVLPLNISQWEVEWDASYNKTWRLLSGGSSWQIFSDYGAIGEMVLTDGTETTAERQKIEGYLAHKWGTEANLPTDHPYKTTPPETFVQYSIFTIDGQTGDTTINNVEIRRVGNDFDVDGDALVTGYLNVTGNIRSGGELVCLADGTNCQSYDDSWINDTFYNKSQVYNISEIDDGFLTNTGDSSTGNYVFTDNITANYINAQISWSNLTNYPSACPAGEAITQLGDTLTCTAFLQSVTSYWNQTNDYIHLINNSKEVGIGTDTPRGKLEVKDSIIISEINGVDVYTKLDTNLTDFNIELNNVLTLNWTPEQMEVSAWYDAEDNDTITTDTGVSNWEDKSGNGHNMSQGTGSLQPPYNPSDSIIGNRSSIGYSGDRTFLTSIDEFNMKRVYVVAYYDNSTFGNWDVLVADTDNDPRWSGRSLQDKFSGGSVGVDSIYKNGNTSFNYEDSGSVLPMDNTLWTTEFDVAANETWRILSGSQSWQQWTRYGAVSEIVFTDGTESSDEKEKIEGYLAHKWGLADNLPSNHTYKNATPTYESLQANIAMSMDIVNADITINNDLNVSSNLWVGGMSYLTDTVTIGSASNPLNLIMFSPNGSQWSCGVNNTGSWGCS